MPSDFSRPLIIAGTRPEAIKLAPLFHAFKANSLIQPSFLATGQHRTMLTSVLDDFEIKPDMSLDVMEENQSLSSLSSKLLLVVENAFGAIKSDSIFVQGDTTTAFIAALVAFYHKLPVLHVEAGLRSHDNYSPWPEEMNRKLISRVASFHYAPTEKARVALIAEGIQPESILVTGNTGIDALLWMKDKSNKMDTKDPKWSQLLEVLPLDQKYLLVTAHRRESFGAPLDKILAALQELAQTYQFPIIFPVHLNPKVKKRVYEALADIPNIFLTDPLPYSVMVKLLSQSHVVLTDSGGLQEEAPSLGKPVLVMREKTERTEGLQAGTAKLVGTDTSSIVQGVYDLFNSETAYRNMAQASNPYGDGTACQLILEHYQSLGT